MQELEDIKNQLKHFSAQYGPSIIVPAVVKSVGGDDTVEVEFEDGSTIDDARLRSVVKEGNKFILLPEVGSTVLIGKIEQSDECVVLAVESITEMKCKIGTTEYDINTDGHLIKQGSFELKDAVVKIIEAVEQIKVIQGTNPDFAKLIEAKMMINTIFQ